MDKLVIAVIICFFPFIVFYPVDTQPADVENITSSTKYPHVDKRGHNWGGDQMGNPNHCGNTIGWWEITNNITGEVTYLFDGGCHV